MGLCQCRNLDLSICTARCHFDVHMLQPQISSVALTVSSLLDFSDLMNPHTPFPCYLIRDHSFHPVWTARTGSSAVQIFSGSTLRELDAGAYEEAPASVARWRLLKSWGAAARRLVHALDPPVAAWAARGAA